MKVKKIDTSKIDAIFFDFDGVLTDNKLLLNESGQEMVTLSRSDGLAFDALRVLKINCMIISTERSKVVKERAKKLKISVMKNIKDKAKAINTIVTNKKFNLQKCIYIGNDINDYDAMNLCGLKICTSDSHNKIKKIANIILKTKGGNGVVRELVEKVLNIDMYTLLYKSER